MSDDRVTCYRFDWSKSVAAESLCRALKDRGLDARMLTDWPGVALLITLPAAEVPLLRQLQRDEPGRFGERPGA